MRLSRLSHPSRLLCLAFICTVLAPAPFLLAAQHDRPASYRLGIFPYLAPRQTIEFYGPVALSMEKALTRAVNLESQPSFTDYIRTLRRHVYDIALIQPFDYPEVVEKLGYIPLVQLAVPLITQFYVRSDSKYQKLEDLRGTKLAMPPARSANARMAIRALYDNKILPGRDIEVRYFNSHDSCIQQVWIGNASACSTALPPITLFQNRMHASLRSIYDTSAIPHVMFVAHPRVPAEDRERLKQLMANWVNTEDGKQILKSLGFPGFVLAKPTEYAVMKNYEISGLTTSPGINNRNDLILGVLPYLAPRLLAKNVAPVLPAFSEKLAMPVRMRTAANFGRFMDDVSTGTYDVILLQPFEYTKAIHSGYLPLASMKEHIQGKFFVKASSSYRTIDDFKGKVIAMGPIDSAQARLGRDALIRAGYRINQDVTIRYRNTHDSCLNEVQRGAAAACLTSPLVLQMLPEIYTKNLRAVGETAQVPGMLFLAHKRLPEQMRSALTDEILSWKHSEKGRVILDSLQLGEFDIVTNAEYLELPPLEGPP